MHPTSPEPNIRPKRQNVSWQIELQPSQHQLHGILGCHTLGSTLILCLNTYILMKLAMLLAVSIALIYALRHWQELSKFTSVYLSDDTIFINLLSQPEPIEAIFYGPQLISDKLCLLTLQRSTGGFLRLPLFRDSADTESLRRLRQFVCSTALAAPPQSIAFFRRPVKAIAARLTTFLKTSG